MDGEFRFEDFRPVALRDAGLLEPRLTASPEQSCEFLFSNLFCWSGMYRTVWQDFHGILCFWMREEDILILAEAPGRIGLEDCLAVSGEMMRHGYSGVISHIRADTLERLPSLKDFYRIERMPDEFGEYIYDVETLAELPGGKLSRKRNPIRQFKRDHPDHEVVLNAPELIPSARALAEAWRIGHEDPDAPGLQQEAAALHRALDHWQELHMEFPAIVCDGRVVAFSLLSRIGPDLWDEPFEKADHAYKGASQFITSESARVLIGRGRRLNREQDLGSPGMRQAKRSFLPAVFLKNFELTPRETVIPSASGTP